MLGSNLFGSAMFGSPSVGGDMSGEVVATSGASGSLSVVTSMVGAVVATSNVTMSPMPVVTGLFGTIAASGGASGQIEQIKKLYAFVGQLVALGDAAGALSVLTTLAGSAGAASNVPVVNLDVQPPLIGTIAAVSNVLAASLDIQSGLAGLVAATSGASGRLRSEDAMYDTIGATSGASGNLSVDTHLIGSAAATSGAIASLSNLVQLQALTGSLAAISNVPDVELAVITGLFGSITEAISTISHLHVTPRSVNFYESVAAQITKYFKVLADENSLVARYDNDLRNTPTDDLWCDVLIDFGNSEQRELGLTNSFRVVGNLSVRIKNAVGLGIGEQLIAADTIAAGFRSENVGRISFETPRVANIGRVGDNNLINVTCPFFVDKPAS